MAIATKPRAGGTHLLSYRPWRGELRGPWYAILALARTGVWNISRRWLFWGLYACSVLVFLFYFFGQYFMVWIGVQLAAEASAGKPTNPGGPEMEPERFVAFLRDALKLNGSGETFCNFIWTEGYIVAIVLALAGAILVGNDFRFGSLPFYLSKPINRWHYVLGKCLAVGVFVNAMTTLLAVGLWVQYGMLDEWRYYYDQIGLLGGILAYGAVLTVVLSLLLVATAAWLRRTVPLVMVWSAVFVFGRILGDLIAKSADAPAWRLIDLWNNLYVVGAWAMGLPADTKQPTAASAMWTLAGVCVACGLYLDRRIRAVEVVR